MSITAFLSKVVGRQLERKQTHDQEFRSMVLQLAGGKEPDAERVEVLLREMGKSTEDLKSSVELYLRRKKLRDHLDNIPNLKQERKSLEQELKAADDVLEQAEKVHSEATSPLYHRIKAINDEIRMSASAVTELHRTCPAPALCERLSRASSQLASLSTKHYAHSTKVTDYRNWLASDRQAVKTTGGTRGEELKERIEYYAKILAENEQAVATIGAEMESLRNEEREVRRLMLDP